MRHIHARKLAEGLRSGEVGVREILTVGWRGSPVENAGGALGVWLHGTEDAALGLDLTARAEAALRGKGPPLTAADLEPAADERSLILQACLPNLQAPSWTAIGSRTLHRMARLLVRILALRRERGRLPGNDAELRAWLGAHAALLDAGRFDEGILYENPGPGMIRLIPDPAAAVPPLIAARMAPTFVRPNLAGSAPARVPFTWGPTAVEIHLPPAGSPPADGGK